MTMVEDQYEAHGGLMFPARMPTLTGNIPEILHVAAQTQVGKRRRKK
jgi:hypothetical protein